jgi:hypothetical protein
MRIVKEKIWTWFLPDDHRPLNPDQWRQYGGKWLVFDRRAQLLALVHKLKPFIDSGDIHAAKSWNGDPSGLNIYALDKDKQKVKTIVESCGAKPQKVWEYDYAWGKNVTRPVDFIYSWASKFITIYKSSGICGAIQLLKNSANPD